MPQPGGRALERMLLDMFSPAELRRLLRYLPGGDGVVAELPGENVAPVRFVEAVVEVLGKRGMLDATFFDMVRAERPRRVAEIDRVAKEVVGAASAVPRSTDPPEPTRPTQGDVVLVFAPDATRQATELRQRLETAIAGVNVLPVRLSEWNEGYLERPTMLVAILCSPAAFEDDPAALRDLRRASVPVVPVLVAESNWRSSTLGRLAPLPSNAVPVAAWGEPREAWADVVAGLAPRIRVAAPVAVELEAVGLAAARALTEVFRTTGVPDLNFVEPAQLPDLVARLRLEGEGLVVDGPSGIGKTTAVRRALAVAGKPFTWLSATIEDDHTSLDRALRGGPKGLGGTLVIDDFHRLDRPTQSRVATFMKAVADAGGPGKVVVIGVNPVGTSLVQEFPDLAGRFRVVPMRKQPDLKIAELIDRSARIANLVFAARDDLILAAAGSFYAAQLLCLESARFEGVEMVPASVRTITAGPSRGVVDRVREQLAFKYHTPLLAFVSWCESPPPQGATLALLWLLASRREGTISFADARARFPELAAPLGWLMRNNLAALFAREPRLPQLFFYNRDAGVLSVEDPQLEFFLRTVSWPGLARDSGHSIGWGDDGSPNFSPPAAPPADAPERAPAPSARPRARILHLSDLHFSDRDAALTAYDQLWEDLGTLKVAPDVVVVSGDLTTRAEPAEFDLVADFLRSLQEDFKLDPSRFVLVPGNHDQSWEYSERAYATVPLDAGLLRQRFEAFARLHFDVRAETWPLDVEAQALVYRFPELKLVFVGLNSAWQIDHQNPDRADIHSVALGRALRAVAKLPDEDALRIAVWHHPIQPGKGSILDTGFLERLANAGFRLGLHGHMHRAKEGLYRFDMTAGGRRLDLCGAGTFGAPTHAWAAGHPHQYQLLDVDGGTLTVHTRRKEEMTGAWKPDARWTDGTGAAHPYYTIRL